MLPEILVGSNISYVWNSNADSMYTFINMYVLVYAVLLYYTSEVVDTNKVIVFSKETQIFFEDNVTLLWIDYFFQELPVDLYSIAMYL